jgi:hypothetical protein
VMFQSLGCERATLLNQEKSRKRVARHHARVERATGDALAFVEVAVVSIHARV